MSASREELDWLAFQYAVGELSPAEQAEFERLLATDQAATDALAEAVELLAATRQALARPVVRRPVLRWIGYAAAASLVLWLAMGAPVPGTRQERPVADRVDPERAIALAWSQLLTSTELDEAEMVRAWSDDATILADTEPLVTMDDDADVELPAWLMTLSTLQPGPSKPNNPNGSG
jgi:anti-sigma-K factor RskA